MSDSVLDTTKKVLGVAPGYDVFDVDIIMHINSVFSTLHQLGVGPATPFVITDNSDLWSSFMGTNTAIESAKSYVWAKVRLSFDPPATSFGIEALERLCKEIEWRLNVQSEEITA
jgi:hypothetical protein